MLIAMTSLEDLLPHEKVEDSHLTNIIEEIYNTQNQSTPILVDRHTRVIIDGHHRVRALKQLGARAIGAILLDYFDDSLITISSWRETDNITKTDVIRAGLTGELFPAKTSKHSMSNEIFKKLEIKVWDLSLLIKPSGD